MRVVVTGASGNVGTALLERLSSDENVESIVGVARRTHSWGPGKVTWKRADVAEDDLQETFRGADAVVHLAWLFQPTRHPGRTWQANVVGTQRVLDAVSRADVPALVVASSVGAYSPRANLETVDESWPTLGCATAAYSREKAFVERMLDAHEARYPHRRVVRMRPAFIFQRSSADQQRRLFLGPFTPRAALQRGRLPVLPLPRGLHLQALHSSDAADAYARAVTQQVEGAFNLTTEGFLDGTALAEVIGTRKVDVPVKAVRAALAAAYLAHAVPASPGLFDLAMSVPMMSAERARTELGWQPQFDARASVAAFLEGTERDDDGPTPPLAGDTSGALRSHEIATGVGERP